MPTPPAVAIFLFLGACLVLGHVARIVSRATRVSDLAVLLLAGLVAGPVLGLVDASAIRPALLMLAPLGLVVVLFEGGLELGWREMRAHGPRALAMSLGIWGASAAAGAAVAHHALAMSWPVAVLFGLAVSATGIFVVIPLLAAVKAPPAARVVLTLETALGDLLAVVAVTAACGLIALGATPADGARLLATELVVGGLVGAVAGLAWSRALSGLPKDGHAYAITFAVILLTYGVAETFAGSGFVAALVVGLVVGNAPALAQRLPRAKLGALDPEARSHQSELIFALRAVYFVALGACVTLDAVTPAALAGAGALVVALLVVRALIVRLALGAPKPGDPVGYRTLLVAVMPRGLATALTAGIPIALGVPGTEAFLTYAFLVILGADAVTTAGVALYERRVAATARRAPAAATATLIRP